LYIPIEVEGPACCLRFHPGAGTGSAPTYEFKELDLNQTLLENGVIDDAGTFESLNLPSDYHIPVLHVYWNDDLTVA
jgi:hypothetical protein